MCYLETGDKKCGYIQEMSNVLPGDRRSVDLQVCTLLPLDRERPGFDLPIIIISSWSFLLYCYIVTSSLKSKLLNQEIMSDHCIIVLANNVTIEEKPVAIFCSLKLASVS